MYKAYTHTHTHTYIYKHEWMSKYLCTKHENSHTKLVCSQGQTRTYGGWKLKGWGSYRQSLESFVRVCGSEKERGRKEKRKRKKRSWRGGFLIVSHCVFRQGVSITVHTDIRGMGGTESWLHGKPGEPTLLYWLGLYIHTQERQVFLLYLCFNFRVEWVSQRPLFLSRLLFRGLGITASSTVAALEGASAEGRKPHGVFAALQSGYCGLQAAAGASSTELWQCSGEVNTEPEWQRRPDTETDTKGRGDYSHHTSHWHNFTLPVRRRCLTWKVAIWHWS